MTDKQYELATLVMLSMFIVTRPNEAKLALEAAAQMIGVDEDALTKRQTIHFLEAADYVKELNEKKVFN